MASTALELFTTVYPITIAIAIRFYGFAVLWQYGVVCQSAFGLFIEIILLGTHSLSLGSEKIGFLLQVKRSLEMFLKYASLVG